MHLRGRSDTRAAFFRILQLNNSWKISNFCWGNILRNPEQILGRRARFEVLAATLFIYWLFTVTTLTFRGSGSSVGIATDYGLDGPVSVYNEQASRKVVRVCYSVYVAECSETSS